MIKLEKVMSGELPAECFPNEKRQNVYKMTYQMIKSSVLENFHQKEAYREASFVDENTPMVN